jgi:hypothetical protein
MNRYQALSEADAQGVADCIHAQLVATDACYAASVRSGQTQQWDIPKLVKGNWMTFVDERGLAALTAEELLRVT